jgi:predicted transcriptional regulator with HTH domain
MGLRISNLQSRYLDLNGSGARPTSSTLMFQVPYSPLLNWHDMLTAYQMLWEWSKNSFGSPGKSLNFLRRVLRQVTTWLVYKQHFDQIKMCWNLLKMWRQGSTLIITCLFALRNYTPQYAVLANHRSNLIVPETDMLKIKELSSLLRKWYYLLINMLIRLFSTIRWCHKGTFWREVCHLVNGLSINLRTFSRITRTRVASIDNVKQKLLAGLRERWNGASKAVILACVLDPRSKNGSPYWNEQQKTLYITPH